MNLRDKADKIINAKAHTDDDIVELSQIAYTMAKQYSEAVVIAGEMERKYNEYRAEKTVEARKEGMAVGEAGDIGKFSSECKYGEYRKLKEKCRGMKVVIDQIDAFRVSFYRKQKSLDGVLSNKQS